MANVTSLPAGVAIPEGDPGHGRSMVVVLTTATTAPTTAQVHQLIEHLGHAEFAKSR